jgi:ribosomal protein L37AE/L43A
MWLVDKVKEKRDELERISKPHTSETTICPGCRNKIPLDDYEWHIWSCDKFYKYAKQSPK